MSNNRKKHLQKLAKLNEEIKHKQEQRDQTKEVLAQYEQTFLRADRLIRTCKWAIRRVYNFFRSCAAFLLGRRNIKHLYSKSFKMKHAINQLKPYKYYLYNLGFIEPVLYDLQEKLKETNHKYLRRAIHWELGLWYANQGSLSSARRSLYHFHAFATHEQNEDVLRRVIILQAENLLQLNYREEAQLLIREALDVSAHPDLYLAMANAEQTVEARLYWLNQTMKYYDLQEISLKTSTMKPPYNDLHTASVQQMIKKGPKVSIILPAYNAENSIHVAIESILEQTWQNIELLVIDDCSTDETKAIVKRYMEKDDRIKLDSTPENSGPYVARNIGLKQATGEFVTVNDADDWSHAEKIAIQVQHLINHPEVIANTSEHARLTENLTLYRRGNPGKYIFSNMSSLMFRRKPVMKSIGYWDCVRFAADGEFKRRLVKQFGKECVVDLKTGPLSFPRQAKTSLTASSAFGYHGFFMGARKEYVESFSHYHKQAKTLYYPYPQKERLFPVPEPMWPKRMKKYQDEQRHFEIVIASDFQKEESLQLSTEQEITVHQKLGIHTGIIHMSCYNLHRPKELNASIRQLINGKDVQTLVYGEKITCDVLIIKGHSVLEKQQKYLPIINPRMVVIVLDDNYNNLRECSHQLMNYYGKRGVWYVKSKKAYEQLKTEHAHEIRYISLAKQPWGKSKKDYESRIDDWLTDEDLK